MDSLKRALVAVGALAVAALAAVPGAHAATVKTVATGLDNPRGVAVAPDGSVFVANAGRGGSSCMGEGEDAFCLGFTSRIVRYADGKARTYAKGLISASGPDGTFATGADGVSVSPDGKVYTVTTSGTRDEIKAAPRPFRRQAGRLFRVRHGGFSAKGNISRVEWRDNVDGVEGDLNSNPYAVLALRHRQIVVDAGANAVFEVRDRKVKLLAVIPKNGDSQAVPSSIARGPDGALYVGELAEGAGPGNARVWRIPARGGTPEVYRSGFTTITGVAFGPDGSLYVTEFAKNPAQGDFSGAVVRVAPGGNRTRLGAGKLVAPQGAAVDANGAIWVSNYSVLPREIAKQPPINGTSGTLVKITR
jgi:glucose/arabinose dehydrogenase